ncbi:MAG: hypothetical protein IPK15_26655 [Verrucomicrobia bacterium]|nr:hypothetical protein [Verrucomicrobiota bacterium]
MEAVVAPARGLPFVGLVAAAFFTGFLLVLTVNRDRFSSKTALAVGIPLREAQSRVRECTKRLQICHKNFRKTSVGERMPANDGVHCGKNGFALKMTVDNLNSII